MPVRSSRYKLEIHSCYLHTKTVYYIYLDIVFWTYYIFLLHTCMWHAICGEMASLLTSNFVRRGFKPVSGKTRDYAIGICCSSAKE